MSNITKTLRVRFVRRQNWDPAASFWTLALILGMIQENGHAFARPIIPQEPGLNDQGSARVHRHGQPLVK
jgi:hypothetical protein